MNDRAGVIKKVLAGLHHSGAARMMQPLTQGIGVIFMLHRVDPEPQPAFAPSGGLTVTPDFLEAAVSHVLKKGYDVVDLDGALERLTRGKGRRPFAVFTFDDGYRDNRDHALPIFKRHGVPMTIYIPTAYPDRQGNFWWLELEEAFRRLDRIEIEIGGEQRSAPTRTTAEKYAAFEDMYWWLRACDEAEMRRVSGDLARKAGFDSSSLCRDLIMDWDEIKALADEPLVTFGAHTIGHWAVAKLPPERADAEIRESKARMEAELGRPCRHFAYPYGDPGSAGERDYRLTAEAGFASAVTTRRGLIKAKHKDVPTGLPRLSLNGDYQDVRYLDALLTGLPFAMLDAAAGAARLARR